MPKKKVEKEKEEKRPPGKKLKPEVNPALERRALNLAARTAGSIAVTTRQDRGVFKGGVKKGKKEKASKKEVPIESDSVPILPLAAEDLKPKKPSVQEVGETPAVSEARSSERHPERQDRYFEAVGRRKTAVARVRLFTKAGDFTVNDKPYNIYFPTQDLQKTAEDALQKMKLFGRFRVSAKVYGGGVHAQAEAVRHGLARCLTKFNPDFRKRLKRAGFLRRDPRMKERKKPGLKKARRAPQWQKR